MAVAAPAPPRVGARAARARLAAAPGVLGWLTTVDHKRIGLLYLGATAVFFCAGGVEALVMRTQLAQPNEHLVGPGDLRRAVHDARGDDDLPVRHPDVDRARSGTTWCR